jgi:hypothetical protein
MHYRFFADVAAEEAQDLQHREHVLAFLTDEGFCSQGRWGGGMADWLVIGGRWSGELSRRSWAQQITSQIEALERKHAIQVWGVFYGDADKQRIQQELATHFQDLWDTHAPEAYKGIPFQRDTYQDKGYADDAMLLTQGTMRLPKEYEGQEESEYHADLDCEPIEPDMVGKKWIVVVDYHN